MNEATADSIAALLHGDPLIGETTIPGQPALRDLGPLRDFASVTTDDPHEIGLVYGSANWDLVERIGWERLGRILIAGLPYLAPEPKLPTEYRNALRSGDAVVYGGAYRAQIDQVFAERQFDAIDQYADVVYLDDGVAHAGALANGQSVLLFFSEFPGSTRIDFSMSGTGDADLLVAGSNVSDPDDPSTYLTSEGSSSSEAISLTPYSHPSVHDDDQWVVVVYDYEGDGRSSTYSIVARQTLPPPALVTTGAPFDGALALVGEIDFVTFAGTAGHVVRLEAEALAPTMDPAVAIFDPGDADGGSLAWDDDDGPGLDALIQGVRLPHTGSYGVAIYSPAADVDPTIGTGGYRLRLTRCTAAAPDSDQDGLADACDDDDDGDDFDDPEEDFPLDPLRCVDYDEDSCDDCSGGAWNFFADGPDVESDGYCDAGDPDDDNDGCGDAGDASPLSASVDGDLDFLGDDCDNCPAVANADQADCNANGLGDACDATPCPEPGAALGALAALVATRWRAARARTRPRSARPR
jgi:hypothetical protein